MTQHIILNIYLLIMVSETLRLLNVADENFLLSDLTCLSTLVVVRKPRVFCLLTLLECM